MRMHAGAHTRAHTLCNYCTKMKHFTQQYTTSDSYREEVKA